MCKSGLLEANMTWEAIAAIGQLLGAVAVVATLLYIAREVRQNSRSLSISALRDTTAQWNHWSEMIATSTDLAEIVSKGNKSSDNLSESESLRYGAYVQSFFDNVDRVLRARAREASERANPRKLAICYVVASFSEESLRTHA